jgi:ArsR family transcriptional regulator, virulence genes transcriptional regulator
MGYVMGRDSDTRIFEMQADACLALANPKRLKILNLLKDGEMSVARMTEEMGVNKANLSQHLSILRQKNILETRRQGTTIYYRISNPKITEACTIMRAVLIEILKEKVKLSKRLKEVKLR